MNAQAQAKIRKLEQQLGTARRENEDFRNKLEAKAGHLLNAHRDLVRLEYLLGIAVNALRPAAAAAPQFAHIVTNTCVLTGTHSDSTKHVGAQDLRNAADAISIIENNLQKAESKEVNTEEMKGLILAMLGAILALQRTHSSDEAAIKRLQDAASDGATGDLNDPAIQEQLDAVLRNAAAQPPETATASAPPVGVATPGAAVPQSPQPGADETTGAQALGDGGSSPRGANNIAQANQQGQETDAERQRQQEQQQQQ